MRKQILTAVASVFMLSALVGCGSREMIMEPLPVAQENVAASSIHAAYQTGTVISTSFSPDNNMQYGFDFFNVQYTALDGTTEILDVRNPIKAKYMLISISHKVGTPANKIENISQGDKEKVRKLINTLRNLIAGNENDLKIIDDIVKILEQKALNAKR